MHQSTCFCGLQWTINVYVEAINSSLVFFVSFFVFFFDYPFVCARARAQLVLGERWPHCARAPSAGDAVAAAGDAAGGASGSEGEGSEAVHTVSGVTELGSIVAAMVGMATAQDDGHEGLASAHVASDQVDDGAPADDATVEAAGGAKAMSDDE